jgi:hypothetical protein
MPDGIVEGLRELDRLYNNEHGRLGKTKERGEKKQGRQHRRRESKGYFHTLQKAAEEANRTLEKKNSSFRFCVYEKGADIYIDLTKIDREGHIIEETTKNITHQDFRKWIEDIAQIEGIYFDRTV